MTGPGRPFFSALKARRIAGTVCSGSFTGSTCLVTLLIGAGRVEQREHLRGLARMAERQQQHRGRIGIGRGDAGKRVLGAGPYCIAKTPAGLPLATRAAPSAMWTPTRSWRQITGRMPPATAASMIGVVGKQNIVEMPSRFRISVIASMTSIGFAPLGKRC